MWFAWRPASNSSGYPSEAMGQSCAAKALARDADLEDVPASPGRPLIPVCEGATGGSLRGMSKRAGRPLAVLEAAGATGCCADPLPTLVVVGSAGPAIPSSRYPACSRDDPPFEGFVAGESKSTHFRCKSGTFFSIGLQVGGGLGVPRRGCPRRACPSFGAQMGSNRSAEATTA